MSDLGSVLFPVLAASFVLALLLCLTLAVGRRTRWSLEQGGIALRAASLLFMPLHVKWEELDWIRVGSGVVHCPGTNLDARVLLSRHVVLHRTARRYWTTPPGHQRDHPDVPPVNRDGTLK